MCWELKIGCRIPLACTQCSFQSSCQFSINSHVINKHIVTFGNDSNCKIKHQQGVFGAEKKLTCNQTKGEHRAKSLIGTWNQVVDKHALTHYTRVILVFIEFRHITKSVPCSDPTIRNIKTQTRKNDIFSSIDVYILDLPFLSICFKFLDQSRSIYTKNI